MPARMIRRALGFVAILAASGFAQAPSEPRFADLARSFQREYLSIGALLQVVADVQDDRNQAGRNGFQLANARVRISGQLDAGFDYLIRVNVAEAPSVLDAAVGYRATPAITVRGGMFKSPFSRELLTGAGGIDFVNRSQVVTALAPNRQVGVQVGGRSGAIEYAAGAFNGNGRRAGGNDNDMLLYVGRASLWPVISSAARPADRLEIGASVAHSDDAAAPIGVGFLPNFQGTRTLWGVDARWQRGPWLVAGEAISAKLDGVAGARNRPEGYHATLGYTTSRRTQALARWDDFRADGLGISQQLLILGLNFWPTSATELQVNAVTPVNRGGVRREQLLVNLQFAF